MKKVIEIVLLLFIISCSNKPKYDYIIINEDTDRVFDKTSIEIQLKEELSEADLKKIALEIKDRRSEYHKLYIFYFLPDQEPGNGAWATSHFKPELKVEILGATKEDSSKMNTTKVTGEILNSWFENDPMLPNKKYLVKENDKLYMKSIYAKSKLAGDGGEMKEEIFINKLKDGSTRYDYKNNHGEYYLIEKNGNLGLYDDSGKFMEAEQIN
ncbi:hypothetical protein LCGC14_0166840 [marine sediment metagenome]|uniref:Uncharacterized protein n=1 Tax=marine sediment metagenome TaxID=412755 RepID=A0A0F9XWA6_9ZZZZ|nr:hypothetical protein [Maribacter sp.]HDZ07079.1 hypothetical protein [Maribacter sp.]HEA80590.1 hypothetical protein [Maribacter sp.]